MLEAFTAAGITLPPKHPWQWVMDCKHVGAGDKALAYLGRYLYRGVLQEEDILDADDHQVTFRYKNAKTRKKEKRTLSGADFLWLILQHVLPKGLHRARNFGFLHPNSKRLIQRLQLLLNAVPRPIETWFRPRAALVCPCCGGEMRIARTRLPPGPSPCGPPTVLGVLL